MKLFLLVIFTFCASQALGQEEESSIQWPYPIKWPGEDNLELKEGFHLQQNHYSLLDDFVLTKDDLMVHFKNGFVREVLFSNDTDKVSIFLGVAPESCQQVHKLFVESILTESRQRGFFQGKVRGELQDEGLYVGDFNYVYPKSRQMILFLRNNIIVKIRANHVEQGKTSDFDVWKLATEIDKQIVNQSVVTASQIELARPIIEQFEAEIQSLPKIALPSSVFLVVKVQDPKGEKIRKIVGGGLLSFKELEDGRFMAEAPVRFEVKEYTAELIAVNESLLGRTAKTTLETKPGEIFPLRDILTREEVLAVTAQADKDGLDQNARQNLILKTIAEKLEEGRNPRPEPKKLFTLKEIKELNEEARKLPFAERRAFFESKKQERLRELQN